VSVDEVEEKLRERKTIKALEVRAKEYFTGRF